MTSFVLRVAFLWQTSLGCWFIFVLVAAFGWTGPCCCWTRSAMGQWYLAKGFGGCISDAFHKIHLSRVNGSTNVWCFVDFLFGSCNAHAMKVVEWLRARNPSLAVSKRCGKETHRHPGDTIDVGPNCNSAETWRFEGVAHLYHCILNFTTSSEVFPFWQQIKCWNLTI